MHARRPRIGALGFSLCLLWSAPGSGADCIPGAEPPIPEVPLTGEEQSFLDDFGPALRRFQGLTPEDFLAEYSPAKEYLGAERSSFIRGDANGDFRLDISDPIFLLRYLFVGDLTAADVPCPQAMDANDSGSLNIVDAAYLLQYLFVEGTAPPQPFPDRGPDPTPDTLPCGENLPAMDYDPQGADYLDLILSALADDAGNDEWRGWSVQPLSADQEAAFRRNGFVISDTCHFDSFLGGYGWVLNNDLPVYISVDSILDTLHLSFDRLLRTIEEDVLYGDLDAMLQTMDGGIEDLRHYSVGTNIEAELDDVALWICMARSLLQGEAVPCARGQDAAVAELLDLVADEDSVSVDLFGWRQCEDFSQFRPRGHYTDSPQLERYFRCMMWIQRIGMKFVQLEYQAAIAFLLTRNLHDTGAIQHWQRIDGVVEAFVGESDSLNPAGMATLLKETGADSAAFFYDEENFSEFVGRALATGAGRQRINSQIIASNPSYVDGFTPIPPAFHLMGQRFIVDSFVFTNVVFDRVNVFPRRFMPSPLDALFVQGNRSTLPLLTGELMTYQYHPNLAALDWIVARYDDEFWQGNLYNLWLSALRALNVDTTAEPYPPVMRTREWDLRMLHAQLASWAHLRHDTILYAKPSYDNFACEYPAGWVDPYPEFFEKLMAFAAGAVAKFEALGLDETDIGREAIAYFQHLEGTSRTLAGMARSQLDGIPHSEEEVMFTKGLMHYVWGGAAGWYPNLIFRYNSPGGGWMALPMEDEVTVADVHTSTNTNEVLHVGVGRSNLMLMTAKTDCGLAAYVGPVLSYYEFKEQDLRRLTDEEWAERLRSGDTPPRPDWTRSFIK